MDTKIERALEELCRSLQYRGCGFIELSYVPSVDGNRASVRTTLLMDPIQRASQLMVMEALIHRASTHLQDAKRRLRRFGEEKGIEIVIKED